MSFIVNNELLDNFTVLDSTNNFVIGIDPSTFQIQLYNPNDDNVINSVPVTITELGNGNYRASFIPNLIGSWYLIIIHPIYFPTGKSESYWITEQTNIDSTSFITSVINGIDNESYKLDAIYNKLNEIDNISENLKRALGLMHENIYIDLPTFDEDDNLIEARVRIYSDASSVGTNDNIIGTYIISSEGDGPGKFTSWKQEKI